MFGVLIDDGSDDALHGAELGVEAEEHEHEEEEAAPEGGEGHLEDRTWVSQERKSRSCKFTSKPICSQKNYLILRHRQRRPPVRGP